MLRLAIFAIAMPATRPDITAILNTLYHPGLKQIDLSLGRMERFLAQAGNPHLRLPPVIHVAGTNGKGSLIANLQAIAEAAGLLVHRYISPHLVRFNERIVLAGREIEDDALLELLIRVKVATQEYPLTFFEAATAAAFLAFAENPADLLLLEVGMGGRYDATNVVPQPLLSAITPVGMDHTDFLGETLGAIAREKAGILKRGVPCVIGPQKPDAQSVIEHAAKQAGAPLMRHEEEWSFRPLEHGGFTLEQRGVAAVELPPPALVGAHQIANAATAAVCAGFLAPLGVMPRHAVEGIARAYWPGRLQRLHEGPLLTHLHPLGELWLDGGHNPHAGEILAEWSANIGVPLFLIAGMVKGKDARGFLQPMAAFAEALWAVDIPDEPLSQPAGEVLKSAVEAGFEDFLFAPSIAAALDAITARMAVAKKPHKVLICGSLYLAGHVLKDNR